jgi:hypothetical protein
MPDCSDGHPGCHASRRLTIDPLTWCRPKLNLPRRNPATKPGKPRPACQFWTRCRMQEEFASHAFLAVTCIGVGLLGLGLMSLAMN